MFSKGLRYEKAEVNMIYELSWQRRLQSKREEAQVHDFNATYH